MKNENGHEKIAVKFLNWKKILSKNTSMKKFTKKYQWKKWTRQEKNCKKFLNEKIVWK